MDCEPSNETDKSREAKPESPSTLAGNEPISRPTGSGTPIPMEFVPFGNIQSGHNGKFYEDMACETNDIPHLATTRRRSPRKHPPFMLGEPYPIPQLRPRYWKPGAAEQVCGTKRKHDYHSGHPAKKPRMAPTSATSLLNEKYPGLEYIFGDPVGPSHSLTFTVTVNFPPLEGDFSATGTSKKSAKNNLAKLILTRLGFDIPQKMVEENLPLVESAVPRLMVNQQNPPVPAPPLNLPSQVMNPPAFANPCTSADFTSDEVLPICAPPLPVTQQPPIMPHIVRRLQRIQNIEENAVNALFCLIQPQEATFNLVSEEGQPHDKTFVTELHFMDQNQVKQSCVGKAASKKKSKANAAMQALVHMLGPEVVAFLVQRSNTITAQPGNGNEAYNLPMKFGSQDNNLPSEPFADQFNLPFANHVRSMITAKYEEIMAGEKEYAPQKVIAGVVMTWAVPFIEHSAVITVTTGTKCIEGDFMSTGGLTLNDCHAEVLSTRCLRDYLFSQLEEFRSGDLPPENCVFERLPEEKGVGKFRLKDGVKFHLYISTSPCGDARIFSPKGLEYDEDEIEPLGEEIVDKHPNRANRGVLRSKIEAGEGTIPVANLTGTQTWDAVMQGNALRTMSCSDKVCRWNVVGFQGALLSNFIEPIYYSSIILGSLHHPVHFERAVFGRIKKLSEQLQPPFKLNRPELLSIIEESKRQVKKSPNHAVLWSANWGFPEIVAASKGQCLRPEIASRVAKRMQFIKFLRIYKNPDGRREHYSNIYYADAKMLASEYQNALNQMKDYFKNSGLGSWISKPMEQDSFCISK